VRTGCRGIFVTIKVDGVFAETRGNKLGLAVFDTVGGLQFVCFGIGVGDDKEKAKDQKNNKTSERK